MLNERASRRKDDSTPPPGKLSSPEMDLPNVLPGFEQINRYWDKRQCVFAAKILPGEFYVSKQGEMIVTVLGSCVSACIRDPIVGVGGMNHFMLPEQRENMVASRRESDESTRYGNWAMEFLINEILKLGGRRGNLEIKLFGGSRVIQGMKNLDVGSGNVDFVRDYIRQEGLKIQSEDLGGTFPRKVLYFPDTGSVKVRKLKSIANNKLLERETQYAKQIKGKPTQGEVELF
ncbi:MAG: chemoreceptor glutamine deamidase CheD [Pseudomonadales bacterium]|nr:chemoreceptor glutamine deamidase CheD [Pseudomonadales bacterium]